MPRLPRIQHALRGVRVRALIMACLASLCMHCTPPPPVFPAGRSILAGERPPAPSAPDSLGAELSLTFFEGRNRSTVSATLAALPYDKYKLDFLGLFNVLLASFFFEDSAWTLGIYEEGVYMREQGNNIALPRLGVEPLSVHLFFSYLWGHFLPLGDWDQPVDFALAGDDPGIVRVRYGGEQWLVLLNAETGTVKAYVQEARRVRMEFDRYEKMEGRPVPRRARLFRDGKPVLVIEVRDVHDNPRWRRSPFSIRIPEGFREVELLEPEPLESGL